MDAAVNQAPLVLPDSSSGTWQAELSREFDVLGPFPIHAREQHFLSPPYPIDLSSPVNFTKPWPSAYADGGEVSWSKATASDSGEVQVTFLDIRWDNLRATEGWAALQHHNVLRTTLTVYPPASPSTSEPYLHVTLVQGSVFTILPLRDGAEAAAAEDVHAKRANPEWYAGNIYDMERTVPRAVRLPTSPSLTGPTTYEVWISGDYEIRLFGDPKSQNLTAPVLKTRLSIQAFEPPDLQQSAKNSNAIPHVVHQASHDVVPDFVVGKPSGSALGVGLRNSGSTHFWEVVDAKATGSAESVGITVELYRHTTFAPTQTRILAMHLSVPSNATYTQDSLTVALTVRARAAPAATGDEAQDSAATLFVVSVPLTHRASFGNSPVRATYFASGGTPTAYVAVAPLQMGQVQAPILALHGAGVDIFATDLWAESLPRQNHSWITVPSGRTSWGLDWHGPSAADAWGSLDALRQLVDPQGDWRRAVIVGHSNGGQGAWHLAERQPDRVLGVVAAAGYIKSQAYVPLTQSHAAHFIDPALQAMLVTALTPDDNDLFLGNLVGKPVRAIHGGDDDNVPVWHSRAAVSAIKALHPQADVALWETEGEKHWWPSVLDNPQVQAFITDAIQTPSQEQLDAFTLTVAVPAESGTMQGWRIESLRKPGQLGKIHVSYKAGIVSATTSNVHTFSVNLQSYSLSTLYVNGKAVSHTNSENNILRWNNGEVDAAHLAPSIQLSGRAQLILTSRGPITIVVTDRSASRAMSIGVRLAYDLDTYHKLDAQIITADEAIQKIGDLSISPGNLVAIGLPTDAFIRWLLQTRRTAFELSSERWTLKGRVFDEPALGALFVHPHPLHEDSVALVVSGNDEAGLERAARLIPMRTGVTVPDWIVLGKGSDNLGAAGVISAGLWGRDWSSEESWMS